MSKFHTAAAVSALLLAATPLAAQAQTAPDESMPKGAAAARSVLNLSAYGETKVAPDEATITLGVQTKAATAAEALSQNAIQMNRVVAALHAAGLADKAIQTTNLSLDPQYVYNQNQPPQLTGYQASNDVQITVDDLSKLGRTIDAVVGAGANQVNGISFGLKNPDAASDAARLAAVRALKAKADLYAGATGYHLGRLISLSEGGGYTPSPIRPMMAMAKMSAEATPVSPGELTVRIDISGLYELTP